MTCKLVNFNYQWFYFVSPMMELTAAGLCRTLTCFPLGALRANRTSYGCFLQKKGTAISMDSPF